MRLTVVLAWASCCLTLTSAWPDSYNAWAADLQPGWMIQSYQVGGKTCHCKIPSNETISTTVAVTTAAPTTTAPTTAAPTTTAPTTAAPTTAAPTTAAPSTAAPTTAAPSTAAPTTAAPTTAAPTTAAPTTAAPTTAAPTTAAPSTAAPTTSAPTTAAPTTAAPTTAAPTTVDVGACTMDVTVTAATDLYWTSPGFPSNYPDDITCTLTVTIPADMPMGLVTLKPMAGSDIYATTGCSSDRMTYTTSIGSSAISCGSNLDEISESTIFDGPKTFSLTFTSSSSDGGKTSTGFSYHIRGFDLMG
ncbi:salivary glue protein Sgs-3-like [Penaeus monodon]|uniref:salivary glue protein Sgs-3-like n=1 Tax=Penaeus monodon TaxID=6687 RepID=UPI0018A6DF29|nr:salivary glue protein Sgs-3-like [Penaeus monodon]XP_037780134.1 salivary glue protein Sgs-3-like [Penaeus monodon]